MRAPGRRPPTALVLLLLVSLAVFALACTGRAVSASPPADGATSRSHTIHLERLTATPVELSAEVVLVSVADRVMLALPDGEDGDGDPVFDEDFDPLWYYTLKQRGFSDVEFSGCGGKWRPEWSVPFIDHTNGGRRSVPTPEAMVDAEGFWRLKHFLSHHVVCTFSSVSFCSPQENPTEGQGKRQPSAFADKNVHFQWAAQFISTLTSSPLSFTVDTPRHIRPTGAVLGVGDNAVGTGGVASPAEPWCSYHVSYHDTLCTQQVSPLLQQGKYHKNLREESINGLPEKLIFNNAIVSLFDFFGTPFHHFDFSAKRVAPLNGKPYMEVVTRMTFVVVADEHRSRLIEHWNASLVHPERTPQEARLFERLGVFIGPGGLPSSMRAVLPAAYVRIDLSSKAARTPAAEAASPGLWGAASALSEPEATYEVRSIGKDHGYYSVFLHPGRNLVQQGFASGEAAGSGDSRLRAGDEVRALLMFPLHLLRPRFYNFESFLGSSVMENLRVDKDSNTLIVQVRTTLTDAHIAAFDATFVDLPPSRQALYGATAHSRNYDRPRLLLARFQFQHGWGALKDVPRDASRFSIVPQPIVDMKRRVTAAATVAASSCAATCGAAGFVSEEPAGAGGTMVDHQNALLRMMHALAATSFAPADRVLDTTAEGQCVCHRVLRSPITGGSFLPAPDAAMVFNVLSLGLTFASLAMSFFFRSIRKIICRKEDLVFVETGVVS